MPMHTLHAGIMVDLLEDEFDFVRCTTVQLLADMVARRPALRSLVVDLLVATLTDDIANVRAAGLAALCTCIGDASVAAGVVRSVRVALDDQDAGVRAAAVACAL